MISSRVVCSSISFRKRPLQEALQVIGGLGFGGIDLGALPGVCDHVPYDLDLRAVEDVAATINATSLEVVSVNGDIGDLNRPLSPNEASTRREHLNRLLDLCEAIESPALVLPCGSQGPDAVTDLESDLDLVAAQLHEASAIAQSRGLSIWVEILHSGRLCYNIERAEQLVQRLHDAPIGTVMDFSHIVAVENDPIHFIAKFGPSITHVHIRDARPGDINVSVGRGEVDFESGIGELARIGYSGKYSLELETRDVEERERPEAAHRAGEFISELVEGTK